MELRSLRVEICGPRSRSLVSILDTLDEFFILFDEQRPCQADSMFCGSNIKTGCPV